jgi:transglutaminase-like putative cysteine protease
LTRRRRGEAANVAAPAADRSLDRVARGSLRGSFRLDPTAFDLGGAPARAAAVDHVGSKTGAVCLPRAMATQAMLRRRGIASRLCLGVARDGRSLAAHAWVEVGQQVIIGETDPASGPAYTQVAQFG